RDIRNIPLLIRLQFVINLFRRLGHIGHCEEHGSTFLHRRRITDFTPINLRWFRNTFPVGDKGHPSIATLGARGVGLGLLRGSLGRGVSPFDASCHDPCRSFARASSERPGVGGSGSFVGSRVSGAPPTIARPTKSFGTSATLRKLGTRVSLRP